MFHSKLNHKIQNKVSNSILKENACITDTKTKQAHLESKVGLKVKLHET